MLFSSIFSFSHVLKSFLSQGLEKLVDIVWLRVRTIFFNVISFISWHLM